MDEKMMKRYLILLLALLVCAGAAWYLTKRTGTPKGDAVLASSREAGRADGMGVSDEAPEMGVSDEAPETGAPDEAPEMGAPNEAADRGVAEAAGRR